MSRNSELASGINGLKAEGAAFRGAAAVPPPWLDRALRAAPASSTAVVITPAVSRLPFVPNPMIALVLSTLFVVAGIVHDWKSRGRVHPIYFWGGLVILLSGPARFALGQTGMWQSFARFLVE